MSKRDYRKPSMQSFKPYIVGKPIEEVRRELGLTGRIAKLASNENPLGPNPAAIEAIRAVADQVHLYPDDNQYYLKQTIAQFEGLATDQILIGAGSVEIIEAIGSTFLAPTDEVVASEHSFAMYAKATKKADAVLKLVATKNTYYKDLDAMAAAITPRTKVVFIDNPNNPTGTWNSASEFDRFMDRTPEGVLVVYDCAYGDYITRDDLPRPKKHLAAGRDILVLNTMSKSHGLAGLRIGYAYGPAEIIAHLGLGRTPFNASVPAQAAAIASLKNREFIVRSSEFSRQELDYMIRELEGQPVTIPPSQGNFILIDTKKDAGWLFLELQKRGVIVRPMGEYGFPGAIRVNPGIHEDNVRFVKAFKELLA